MERVSAEFVVKDVVNISEPYTYRRNCTCITRTLKLALVPAHEPQQLVFAIELQKCPQLSSAVIGKTIAIRNAIRVSETLLLIPENVQVL
jgi:hypothetical protein